MPADATITDATLPVVITIVFFCCLFFQRGNISRFHTWGRSHITRVWLLCRIYCHGLIFFFRVFLRTLWAFSSLIQKIWADDMLSEFLLSIITRKQKITSCRSILSTFGEKNLAISKSSKESYAVTVFYFICVRFLVKGIFRISGSSKNRYQITWVCSTWKHEALH